MRTTTEPDGAPDAESTAVPTSAQDEAYLDAIAHHGSELERFVSGYERRPAERQELLQEVHVAIWRSLAGFRGECSLRTWVYRVAHNVGATHVARSGAGARRFVDLDALASLPSESTPQAADRRLDLARILGLIHRLRSPDREVMLLYLEDLDAADIGEITGLSARNVATKIHRIKKALATQLGALETYP